MSSEKPCLPECGFNAVMAQFQALNPKNDPKDASYLWHMFGCPAAEECLDFPGPRAPQAEEPKAAIERMVKEAFDYARAKEERREALVAFQPAPAEAPLGGPEITHLSVPAEAPNKCLPKCRTVAAGYSTAEFVHDAECKSHPVNVARSKPAPAEAPKAPKWTKEAADALDDICSELAPAPVEKACVYPFDEQTTKHKHIGCQTCDEKHIAYLALRAEVETITNIAAETHARNETYISKLRDQLESDQGVIANMREAMADYQALRAELAQAKNAYEILMENRNAQLEDAKRSRAELAQLKERIAVLESDRSREANPDSRS